MARIVPNPLFIMAFLLSACPCVQAQEPGLLTPEASYVLGRLDNGFSYYLKHNAIPVGQTTFCIVQKPDFRPLFSFTTELQDSASALRTGVQKLYERLKQQSLLEPNRYRPHLQAIMIVGKINVPLADSLVKATFSSLPDSYSMLQAGPRPVADSLPPACLKPLSLIPPRALAKIALQFSFPPLSKERRGSADFYIMDFLRQSSLFLLDKRLRQAVLQYPNPFESIRSFADTCLHIEASCSMASVKEAYYRLSLEIHRLRKYGFTESEFQEARTLYRTRLQNGKLSLSSLSNRDCLERCIRHFLYGDPLAGEQTRYDFMQKILPLLTLHHINQYTAGTLGLSEPRVQLSSPSSLSDTLLRGYATCNPHLRMVRDSLARRADSLLGFSACTADDSLLVDLMSRLSLQDDFILADSLCQAALSLPSPDSLKTLYRKAGRASMQSYSSFMHSGSLISDSITPGRIRKEGSDNSRGARYWELSNGAKVWFVSSKAQTGRVAFAAVRKTRMDVSPQNRILYKVSSQWAELTGMGGFTRAEAEFLYPGSPLQWKIGVSQQSLTADFPAPHAETFMQLLYLYFTRPEPDSAAFAHFRENKLQEARFECKLSHCVLADSLYRSLFGAQGIEASAKPAEIESLRYGELNRFRREAFANAADFDFIFVGDMDPSRLRELSCTYIASLPARGRETAADPSPFFTLRGRHEWSLDYPNRAGESKVMRVYSGSCPNTLEQYLLLGILEKILKQTLERRVEVRTGLAFYPRGYYYIYAGSSCPDSCLGAFDAAVNSALQRLADDGPDPDVFDRIKEQMQIDYRYELLSLTFLREAQCMYSVGSQDFMHYYLASLRRLQANALRGLVLQILEQNNITQISLRSAAFKPGSASN